MKSLRIFLFGILVIAMIAVSFVLFSDVLVKKAVTTMGPSFLKVPVELNEFHFSPIKGQVEIQSLTVHNPDSFKSPYALQVQDFAVNLSPMSIFSDTLHIHEIRLSGVTIISEGLRADNHRAIIANLTKDKSAAVGNEPKPDDSEKPVKKKSSKKMIIDRLSFTESKLIIIVDGETITEVDFPAIELVQIGKKGAAVSATEAITQIYTAIMSKTTKVLTVNKEVIKALANAKLKKFGISDVKDLENPEKILKDPEAVGKILNGLFRSSE